MRNGCAGEALTAHVVPVMLRVLLVQGMIWAMGMRRFTTGMVMAVVMMAMLAVNVLVAVMPLAVMHELGVRGARGGGWCWTRL